MQSQSITDKSLKVSLLIGFIFAATSCLLTLYNDSIILFNFSNEQSIAITILLTFSCGLVFLFADNGRNRLKLIGLGAILGLILSALSLNINTVGSPLSIATLLFGAYAGFCLIQSYHESDYSRPQYTTLFACVWNNVCMVFLSSVFLLLVYILISLCFYIFYTFNLTALTAIIKNLYFNLSMVPISLCLGFYFTSRWKTLVFSTRMILLEFFKILLPLLNIITWVFLALLLFNLFLGKVINIPLNSISDLSFQLSFYGLIIINAVYMDGSYLENLSSLYRRSITALCLALPGLLISCFIISLYTAPAPALNQKTISLFSLLGLGFLYSVSYTISAFQHEKKWMSGLKTTNFRLSWVLISLAILLNTPFIINLFQPAPHYNKLYRPIKKIDYDKLTQTLIKKNKLDFKQSKLQWVDSQSNPTPLVLGYRYNQPLTLCQPTTGLIPLGVVNDGKCLAIKDSNRIVAASPYKVLTGNNRAIKWVTLYSRIFYFYHSPSHYKYAACRGIINNRIYLGVIKTKLDGNPYDADSCGFIINGDIVNSRDFKRLHLDIKQSQ